VSGQGPLRVGLAGLGTVGARVARIIVEDSARLAERAGRPIVLSAVSARDKARARGVDLGRIPWVDDPVSLASRGDVDVVVELVGGAEGPARALVSAALEKGKHVVTANKALIAHHGTALAAMAEAKQLAFNYEAAVAGGLPVIKTLREALIANRITKLYGILNGTCNFILSRMSATAEPFADVLAEAQRLGYAEADPAFDIEGTDAAHKLAILASLAFGSAIDFAAVHTVGITAITPFDIEAARELGYAIRLLAIAEDVPKGDLRGLRCRVHPAMVPIGTPLAGVQGAFNAVVIEADPLGKLVIEGPGAGAGPTASAVLSDLADIARGVRLPAFLRPTASLSKGVQAPFEEREGSYYLRLNVVDRPGVIADVARILADLGISIESILQRGRDPGAPVKVVMVTHETLEAAMARALQRLGQANNVLEAPCMIRIEAL
jgi:homoserine dehydrogenase